MGRGSGDVDFVRCVIGFLILGFAESTALNLEQGEAAFITAGSSYRVEGLMEGYAIVAKLP